MKQKELATFLPCGHWDTQRVIKTADECNAEELERLNDRRSVQPYKVKIFKSSSQCYKCSLGLAPDSYQHQAPKFQVPVPDRLRRSIEKQDSPAFPGLCTDQKTGLYIGGLYNNCRDNKRQCVVHEIKRKSKKKKEKEKSE